VTSKIYPPEKDSFDIREVALKWGINVSVVINFIVSQKKTLRLAFTKRLDPELNKFDPNYSLFRNDEKGETEINASDLPKFFYVDYEDISFHSTPNWKHNEWVAAKFQDREQNESFLTRRSKSDDIRPSEDHLKGERIYLTNPSSSKLAELDLVITQEEIMKSEFLNVREFDQ